MRNLSFIFSVCLVLGSVCFGEEHSDAHHDEHEHNDEGKGFALSVEAQKNFGLKTVKLTAQAPWTVPASAVLYSGEEVNIYRLRDGFFKRVDFSFVRKMGSDITVSSPELRSGDEIVSQGVPFLRIAEISAFGGIEAHSH